MNAVERVDEYTQLEIETTASGRSYKKNDMGLATRKPVFGGL